MSMPIFTQQNDTVKKVYFGNNSVQKIYHGTSLVYSAGISSKIFYDDDSGYLEIYDFVSWTSPSYTTDDRTYIKIKGYNEAADYPGESTGGADSQDEVTITAYADANAWYVAKFTMAEKSCTLTSCYWYEGDPQDPYVVQDGFAIEKIWTVVT